MDAIRSDDNIERAINQPALLKAVYTENQQTEMRNDFINNTGSINRGLFNATVIKDNIIGKFSTNKKPAIENRPPLKDDPIKESVKNGILDTMYAPSNEPIHQKIISRYLERTIFLQGISKTAQ